MRESKERPGPEWRWSYTTNTVTWVIWCERCHVAVTLDSKPEANVRWCEPCRQRRTLEAFDGLVNRDA